MHAPGGPDVVEVAASAVLSLGAGVRVGEGARVACRHVTATGDGCTLGWETRVGDDEPSGTEPSCTADTADTAGRTLWDLRVPSRSDRT